jgi:Beta-galactosidase/beta-glucuronidase
MQKGRFVKGSSGFKKIKSWKVFIGTPMLSVCVLISGSILLSGFSSYAAIYSPAQSNRVELNFNTNWLHAPSDVPNGQSATLDESAFSKVCLPHTNKVITHHLLVDKSDFEFISWYRRHFYVPTAYTGRRVLVEFQAVSQIGWVYVNGTLIRAHPGAYTSFTYDITNQVNFGDNVDNVIAVQVDSRYQPTMPPQTGNSVDYLVWGGICRDVKMIIVDPVHLGWVFASADSASLSTATGMMNVQSKIINQSTTARTCDVLVTVVDSSMTTVGTATVSPSIPANDSATMNLSVPVGPPHLWGPDNPYLYKVFTRVTCDQAVADEKMVRTGLRYFGFSKTDGKFRLNGQVVFLRGHNRHESFPFIGRAAPNRLQRRDAELLKYDLGDNVARCSHYPQDPEYIDRCDEIGLMLIEELPGWQTYGNAAWQDVAVNNVEEMVVRDRNHPAIISWGTRINESQDDPNGFFTRTNLKAHTLDPTRPTYGARNLQTSALTEDIFGYNDFHYASGILSPDAGKIPWMVTEYVGSFLAPKMHSWDGESDLINFTDVNMSILNTIISKGNICASFNWTSFDYNTEQSQGEQGNKYSGNGDIFKNYKFPAYFHRAQRDPVKYGTVVYIASYWNANTPSNIWVASNCDSIALFVNNVSQGKKGPNLYMSLPHPVFQIPVTYQAGNIKAIGFRGGVAVDSMTRYTPGNPAKIILKPDDSGLVADGSDMTRVYVAVADQYDQPVPQASNSITFSVTGAGVFLGENPLALENGQGSFFVQTRLHQTGAITCQATSSGLPAGTATVQVEDFMDPVVPGPDVGIVWNAARPGPAGTSSVKFKVVSSRFVVDKKYVGKKGIIYDISGKIIRRFSAVPRVIDLRSITGKSTGVYTVRLYN